MTRTDEAPVAVRERPVFFSAPMVRAILSGGKSQTRRVVKPQPESVDLTTHTVVPYNGSGATLATQLRCPYGAPGDRLWVRETWTAELEWPEDVDDSRLRWWHEVPLAFRGLKNAQRVYYAADRSEYEVALNDDGSLFDLLRNSDDMSAGEAREVRWSSSRHMPRWASRITIEITGVRVERVQDITEEDAEREGVNAGDPYESGDFRDVFHALWDSINAKRGHGWDVNPWCWVLDFRRIEAPDNDS